MDRLRASSERVTSSASAQTRYERHRSASKLKPKEDPLLKCIDLDYTEELDHILQTSGKHYSQEYLDKALCRAARLGKSRCCELLVTAGSDPKTCESPQEHTHRHEAGRTAFTQHHGQRENWAKAHSSVGGTPLHLAVEHGHLHTTQTLLHLGSQVNCQDIQGVTPLMLACMSRGASSMVHLLTLIPGCDVTLHDDVTGKTALHYAAEMGDAANIQLLLEKGAHVDDRDKLQNSPLLLLFSPEEYHNPKWPGKDIDKCLELLLEHGSFVNTYNKDHKSPLQAAVEAECEGGVRVLLQKNALVTDDIVRMAALEVRHSGILELLLSGAHSLSDDFLTALLVLLISSVTSLWSFNASEQERNIHQLAKVLIKNISDVESLTSITRLSDQQLQESFGESFASAMNEQDLNELRVYGLFGYAIMREKYSIAWMICEAGCVDNIETLQNRTQIWQLANKHAYLKTWLPQVLSTSVRVPTDSSEQGEMVTIANIDMRKAFDDIEPFDNAIHATSQGMMDLNYRTRENAKAYLQSNVLIYNNHN